MHKPWCTCDACKKRQLAQQVEANTAVDLSMFIASEIVRLNNYKAKFARGEFTDYPDTAATR